MSQSYGAAAQFTALNLGGPATIEDGVVSVATTITQILQNDPDRVAITMINQGVEDVTVRPSNQVASLKGILLLANGGGVTLNIRDDGVLCSRDWWGVSSAGSSDVYFLVMRRFALNPAPAGPQFLVG